MLWAKSSVKVMIAVLTVFAVLACGSPSKALALSALDIMEFSDSFECNDKFPHHSFCESVQFKAWTVEEKAVVSEYLRNINDPRLAGVLNAIKTGGITKLHRVSFSARWFSNPQFRRVEFVRSAEKAFLWVNPVTNVIGITDSFFTGTPFMDPYAKVDRKQINILHELMHDFDIATNHQYSTDAFEKAAGWNWNGKESIVTGIDYEKAKAQFQDVLGLVKEKKVAEAYALDRELGRGNGYPTLYALTGQYECFAEAVAYYIFDPTAPQYYRAELKTYLDSILSK